MTTTRHIVLVHASASSPRQWSALVQRLEPDWTVHLPALIDTGESASQAAGPPQQLERDGARLVALLDRVGPAHLVGHSYGGAVAFRAANRRPAAVASLAVYEPMLMGWLADDPGAWGELADLTLLARDCRERWLHEGPAPARRIAERLATQCPGVRHHRIAGPGQMGPVTHAGPVDDLILGFLDAQPVPPCHAIA